MKNVKVGTNETLCVLSVILIVVAQAAEKIIEVAAAPGKTLALCCALIYTVLVGAVYLFIKKGDSSFMGMFASLLALKMLPPNINYFASVSPDGAMTYFVLQKASVVIFAVLLYKFYREQPQPRSIKPLTLVALVGAVPFFNTISATTTSFLLYKTGSMMLPYFAEYACYAAAALVILGIAYKSGYASMRFAAYFEFAAFGINIVRRAGKIGYFLMSNQHVSKSIYGWIVLYLVLAAVFAFALSKSKKEQNAAA